MMLQNVFGNRNSGLDRFAVENLLSQVNQTMTQSVYLANVSQSHVHLDIRFADHEHLHRL